MNLLFRRNIKDESKIHSNPRRNVSDDDVVKLADIIISDDDVVKLEDIIISDDSVVKLEDIIIQES